MGMHVDGTYPLGVDDDLSTPRLLSKGTSHAATGKGDAGNCSG